MKTTVLVFHPNIQSSRVNKALASALDGLEDVNVRYMYDLYPDFKIDVEAEKKELEVADRVVFQFPFYWYSTPALFKQWQDDVLEYGWAYGSTGNALHGKEFVVAVSPGGPGENYVRDANFKYTVTDFLRPLQATNNLIGMTYKKPFITAGAMRLTDDELKAQAESYRDYVASPELENLGDYE